MRPADISEVISPSLGTFDLCDTVSALTLAHFIVSLEDQLTTLEETRPSEFPCAIRWRSDDDQKTLVDNIRGWVSTVESARTRCALSDHRYCSYPLIADESVGATNPSYSLATKILRCLISRRRKTLSERLQTDVQPPMHPPLQPLLQKTPPLLPPRPLARRALEAVWRIPRKQDTVPPSTYHIRQRPLNSQQSFSCRFADLPPGLDVDHDINNWLQQRRVFTVANILLPGRTQGATSQPHNLEAMMACYDKVTSFEQVDQLTQSVSRRCLIWQIIAQISCNFQSGPCTGVEHCPALQTELFEGYEAVVKRLAERKVEVRRMDSVQAMIIRQKLLLLLQGVAGARSGRNQVIDPLEAEYRPHWDGLLGTFHVEDASAAVSEHVLYVHVTPISHI